MIILKRNNEIVEAGKEKISLKNEGVLDTQELDELSSFFDLLARFDHEDKLKDKSALKTDLLASAPRGSVLGSDT